MGHPGKHTIDPETGLCEICDQGAIQEIQQGKRPSRHVFYDDYDGRNTYRSYPNDISYAKDRYVYEVVDEPKPRYVRKVVHHQPTVRARRTFYEQPIEEPLLIRRRIIRREHTPPEEVTIRRPIPRVTTHYYVDKEGQMVPQISTPPPPAPRRYVVQTKEIPPPPPTPPEPGRPVRIIRRRIQTPPPPATEVWHTGPRRQTNSDTEIVDRQQRIRRTETYYSPQLQRKPELYHLEGILDEVRYSPVAPTIQTSREYRTPSPRVIERSPPPRRPPVRIEQSPPPRRPPVQNEQMPSPRKPPVQNEQMPPPRKPPNQPEPIPKKVNQPTPTVVRRVYEKLPPGKQKAGKRTNQNGSSKKQSQGLNNGDTERPESGKNPSIYYIRSVDNYD